MNKKIYILPLLAAAALQFSACSNEDDSLFDQSAAERLEAGQKEYFSALCADGGKWVMEYFSNTEEPGYVFVMEFEGDKSVTISTDHKWIGNTFKQEKSLWDVINDNGNVLSFNSYNTLFHVFSNPENIEGTDAPKNPATDKDIDEQGYGHNGDYEFMFLDNDGTNIRLLGKKRAIYAYMRKLASDTDPEAYLAVIKAKRTQFDAKRFPNYVMTETATGALYDVTGLAAGVVEVVPLNSTSPYARTETKACVITASGMRPISAFDFIRENDTHFAVNEFTWADDGTLVAPGVRIAAPAPATNLLRKDLNWTMNVQSFSTALTDAVAAADAETTKISLSAFGRNPKVTGLEVGYKSLNGVVTFAVSGQVGKIPYIYYGKAQTLENGNVKFDLTTPNDAIEMYISDLAPAAVDLLKLFEGEFKVQNVTAMNPSEITFTGVTNPDVVFSVKVK